MSITNYESMMQFIGANDYASTTLLEDSIWCNAITYSNYRDYVMTVKVPTMTSNNTPSGECIANPGAVFYTPNRDLYHAFDGVINTGGDGSAQFTSSYSGWMGYKFTRPVFIYKAIINNAQITSDRACKVDKIQGSNDGSTWEDLYDCEGATDLLITPNFIPLTNYDRYIINVRPTTQYANALTEIQFLGREPGGVQTWLHAAEISDKSYISLSQVLEDTTTLTTLLTNNDAIDYLVTCRGWISTITSNSTAMSIISSYDYAVYTLAADPYWIAGLCSSAYFSSIFDIYVPTMTSATAPRGTVFGSTPYNAQRVPYRAFDGNDDTDFLTNVTGENWIGYQFTEPVCIKAFRIHPTTDPGNYLEYCYQYTIEASNDGTNWTTLYTETARPYDKEYYSIIENETAYTYYRAHNILNKLQASSTYAFNYIGTVQFYGRSDN